MDWITNLSCIKCCYIPLGFLLAWLRLGLFLPIWYHYVILKTVLNKLHREGCDQNMKILQCRQVCKIGRKRKLPAILKAVRHVTFNLLWSNFKNNCDKLPVRFQEWFYGSLKKWLEILTTSNRFSDAITKLPNPLKYQTSFTSFSIWDTNSLIEQSLTFNKFPLWSKNSVLYTPGMTLCWISIYFERYLVK